jgi:hypothetical protein
MLRRLPRRAPLATAAAVVLLASALAVSGMTYLLTHLLP